MTRNPTSLCNSARSLRKPLDRQALRVIGTVCFMGILVGATLGFIAVPRWDVAIVGAILAIPGGLLAGALAVFLQRKTAKQQSMSGSAIMLGLIIVMTAIHLAIPSDIVRCIVLAIVGAAITWASKYYRRK